MSTQDVERELTALLRRRAEDTMDSTDTRAERQRLSEVLETGPGGDRPRWVAGAAVAAAAAVVAVAAVWAPGTDDDATEAPPAGDPSTGQVEQFEREAETLAERVVSHYADHDAGEVATALESGASWPGLVRMTERDRAWGLEHLLRSCAAQDTSSMGIVVECVADTNVFRSLELGVGPFESAAEFSLLVEAGRVVFAEVNYDGEVSGMGDHVLDMWDWLEETHPEDVEFLQQDELDVPAGDWDRWLRLYARRTAEFGEARS
jgi:hypothetical protein